MRGLRDFDGVKVKGVYDSARRSTVRRTASAPDGVPCQSLLPALQEIMAERMDRKREAPDTEESPKARRGDGNVVTVDLLKSLLAEQQKAILEAQVTTVKSTVDAAVKHLEKRQDDQFHRLESRASGQDLKLGDIEKQLLELAGKVKDLETGSTAPPSSSASSGDHRRDKLTVIIGGFARDSRRPEILKLLSEVISKMDVHRDLDRQPFTTRPRTSFAMLRFEQRDHESFEKVKNRMHGFMDKFLKTKTYAKGMSKPLWAGISKTKEERERAQLCGIIRGLVGAFDQSLLDATDFDYNSGTVWIGASKVSSAMDTEPEGRGHDLFRFTTKCHRDWVDVAAVSSELQADKTEVLDFLQEKDVQRSA